MRTREEIERGFSIVVRDNTLGGSEKSAVKLNYIFEVLLDIRDLLTPNTKE